MVEANDELEVVTRPVVDYVYDMEGNVYFFGTTETVLRPRSPEIIRAALDNELRTTRTLDVLILDARGSDR